MRQNAVNLAAQGTLVRQPEKCYLVLFDALLCYAAREKLKTVLPPVLKRYCQRAKETTGLLRVHRLS